VSDDAYDLEMAATTLLGDGHDVRTMIKVLVGDLSAALGDRLHVERKGGLLHKSDEIKSVRINLANEDFEAVLHDAGVDCTVGHSSGGIRIRTEKVDLGQWLNRLLVRLKDEATRSQEARLALEKIVIGRPE
jgi:hypothetical protein